MNWGNDKIVEGKSERKSKGMCWLGPGEQLLKKYPWFLVGQKATLAQEPAS